MRTRIAVAALVMLAGSVGYVAGQSAAVYPGEAPVVYAGENFGFRADGHVGDPSREGKGWVAGTFVVKIDGRWVEARLGAKTMPVK